MFGLILVKNEINAYSDYSDCSGVSWIELGVSWIEHGGKSRKVARTNICGSEVIFLIKGSS